VHTTLDGFADVAPLPQERIYHLAGGQHFVAGFPPSDDARIDDTGTWLGNPVDFRFTLRALALHLVRWVDEGEEPPASRVPTVGAGTLVPPAALAFPAIAGLVPPRVVHLAYRADYGPRFHTEGIVDNQPPALGSAFASLVPQVDGIGNELGGVRGVELRVPLATYTPWAPRVGLPGPEDELRDFVGTVTPLPMTGEVARDAADSRPSLQALYGSRGAYVRRVEAAVASLIREGFLLEEDAGQVIARAARLWDWIVPDDGG
jgi:hypothetical protein